MTVILYGKEYWNEIINFDALVKHGMIGAADLSLFSFASTPVQALELLKRGIAPEMQAATPAFAKTRSSQHGFSYLYQRSGD
jgi:predicted Rossmann-fold nucleotide-binding protein